MTSTQVGSIFNRILINPKKNHLEFENNCNNCSIIADNRDENVVSGVNQIFNEDLNSRDSNEAQVAATYFRIPKFFQAIVTLIICAILLSTTLCIIIRIRQRCSKRKPHNRPKESPALTISKAEAGSSTTDPTYCLDSQYPRNHLQVVRFVRRLSGPFGDDAIAHVRESYQKHKVPLAAEELPRPHST